MQNERTDIHRPSAIIPGDYEFVAYDYIRVESIGDCVALQLERSRKDAHFERTGGKYADHEHGGSCHICGASASYTVTFYHAKSNEYIHTGFDCADKMGMERGSGVEAFRRAISNARDAIAGKRKCAAILAEAGLTNAYEIYSQAFESFTSLQTSTGGIQSLPYEEQTIRELVGKLVKYGSISDKAMGFLRQLVERLPERDKRNAEQTKQRAEEKAAAKPCPTGRVKVDAIVLKVEERETEWGVRQVMTVKADEGFILWGSVPSGVTVDRDCKIVFVATLTPSDNDPKFGFFKRPVLYATPEEKKAAKAAAKALQEEIAI